MVSHHVHKGQTTFVPSGLCNCLKRIIGHFSTWTVATAGSGYNFNLAIGPELVLKPTTTWFKCHRVHKITASARTSLNTGNNRTTSTQGLLRYTCRPRTRQPAVTKSYEDTPHVEKKLEVEIRARQVHIQSFIFNQCLISYQSIDILFSEQNSAQLYPRISLISALINGTNL
jgi:hypothetical protein